MLSNWAQNMQEGKNDSGRKLSNEMTRTFVDWT